MADPDPTLALVLFAHGARDARWAEPFHRVANAVRKAAPELPVELAFLEFMTPDLATATQRLATGGATRIRIVPLFFGQGGHLRNDVPAMVADIAASLPGVALELARAAGDDDRVVTALVEYCLGEARKG
jgi:sirohydrochlorin cobaltochelatase